MENDIVVYAVVDGISYKIVLYAGDIENNVQVLLNNEHAINHGLVTYIEAEIIPEEKPRHEIRGNHVSVL